MNRGAIWDRSLIKINSAKVKGTSFEATIPGYLGHNYQLQYCDDFSNGSWTNIGPSVAGDGSMLTLTHAGGAAAQQRVYRVAVAPEHLKSTRRRRRL